MHSKAIDYGKSTVRIAPPAIGARSILAFIFLARIIMLLILPFAHQVMWALQLLVELWTASSLIMLLQEVLILT